MPTPARHDWGLQHSSLGRHLAGRGWLLTIRTTLRYGAAVVHTDTAPHWLRPNSEVDFGRGDELRGWANVLSVGQGVAAFPRGHGILRASQWGVFAGLGFVGLLGEARAACTRLRVCADASAANGNMG